MHFITVVLFGGMGLYYAVWAVRLMRPHVEQAAVMIAVATLCVQVAVVAFRWFPHSTVVNLVRLICGYLGAVLAVVATMAGANGYQPWMVWGLTVSLAAMVATPILDVIASRVHSGDSVFLWQKQASPGSSATD